MKPKEEESNASFFAGFFNGNAAETAAIEELYTQLQGGNICVPASPGLKNSRLVGSPEETCPVIAHAGKLYFHRYFFYETNLINRIASLAKQKPDILEEREHSLNTLFKSLKFDRENEEQKTAVVNAYLNNFSIITGGPGTGKTTTVASIIKLLHLENPGIAIELAAPTGKAAARMSESLSNTFSRDDEQELLNLVGQSEPKTIHRLLGTEAGSIYFKFNSKRKLRADVIIVDECSMMDIALFSKLLDAVPDDCRLILLGDKYQLSSVEAGTVFGDLCDSAAGINSYSKNRGSLLKKFLPDQQFNIQPLPALLNDNITQLLVSIRSTAGISDLAKAILENDVEAIKNYYTQTVSADVSIDAKNAPATLESFATGFESYISEQEISAAIDKLNQQKILCATKHGEAGVYESNKAVENLLGKKGILQPGKLFYHNRPVILTRNYNDLGVFNGEIGIIRHGDEGVPYAYFKQADKIKKIMPVLLPDMETAFAMTIHKSQGSEFGKVLLRIPAAESKVVNRELLYTGITRAKNKVIIQSGLEPVLQGAGRRVQRASGIADRLKNFSNGH